MLLVLGPLRKAPAIRFLHRRTWLRGEPAARGCSQYAFLIPPRLRAPIAGPASRSRQLVRSPSAASRTTRRPLPTRRSRGPAGVDTPDVTGWAGPAAPPWFPDPTEPVPARRPSASPAWRRSGIEGRAETGLIRHAVPGVAAIRRSVRAPAPPAPDRCFFPVPPPPPPPGAPSDAPAAPPASRARAVPNESRS